MWACAAGLEHIVRLYVLQGADINARDRLGRTAAHHAAASNNTNLYEALREADADFEVVDFEGNTPLHVAVERGSLEFATVLLEGMVNPSPQNVRGDQPSHIAARANNVGVLRILSQYDKHMGRVNMKHETPLGTAKFHCAREAQRFLEQHFTHVEGVDNRNEFGEIWWDKAVDESTIGWRVEVGFRGDRLYVNDMTGETRSIPPTVDACAVTVAAETNQLEMRKNILLVKEGDRFDRLIA